MNDKKIPFSKQELESIAEKFPTPFHIYDEQGMRDYAKSFVAAFDWNPGFKEFYAIKSAPNPFLMKILRSEGFGIDCSSMAELVLAERIGMKGEEIMFTSNDTPAAEYKKAIELGAIINLDDVAHIKYLEEQAGLPELICFRYNPGALKEGNAIIGHPEEAKYGFTREQLFEGYRMLRDRGIKRFGIHTMVASNELNPDYFVETAQILFELIVELNRELGIRFEFANLGGGIGIPYKPEQEPVDLVRMSKGIREAYEHYIVANGLDPLKIYFESGRAITGPFGFLVSRVLHIKNTYKKYAGLDASMANLMRPALYGSYHHITVLGKEENPSRFMYDVTGSLCENNDKFAINRVLPKMSPGDLVVIHDTGAHGHAMGFNYNGKLRSAELLKRVDGSVDLIRRAETLEDYFSTLDFGRVGNYPV
ncbi:MAG: diaminopimelate decarboxylase [Marinilabiliales bacterium]|nr:diaminopimelate decarboxylase [Marinilabiliales bacterium]